MDAFGSGMPKVVPLDAAGGPFETYCRVSRGHGWSFLFESMAGPGPLAEASVIGFGPRAVFRGYRDRAEIEEGGATRTVETGDPLAELRKLLRDAPDPSRRYLGGAVGIAGYDAARLFEDVPGEGPPGEPLMEFGIYDDGILYEGGRASYFTYGEDRSGLAAGEGGAPGRARVGAAEDLTGPEEFRGMVERARRYIRDGDIFQAVLSRRAEFDFEGDDLAVYGALRRLNPSPYMFHLRQGGRTAVGASPEMLVRVTGRRVETFPIAGTREVTGDASRDAELAAELRADEKELAEHTMLVDLGRNDIGRVCSPGSVRVDGLMEVRRFSHVQHMVTHVEGELAGGRSMFDAFRAVFPAGTVTGAPKVRAMEVIEELEPGPRGPYAGAVGYFSNSGCCDFAIAIRSVFIEGGRGFVQAGAGVVSDSVPEREFDETRHKAGAMLQALAEASS